MLKEALQRAGAEFTGTLVLTIVAAGADIVDSTSPGGIGHVARYLAPGLIVTAMTFTLSGISGAHINPAVTVAFALRGEIDALKFVQYIAAQLLGSVAAAVLLGSMFGSSAVLGVTHLAVGLTAIKGFAWECGLTAILVLVILGTAAQKAVVGKNAAIAVGCTVAACGLFSSPISGASMNPARSFGPAIVSGSAGNLWIYVLGPLAGAALASALAWLLYGPPRHAEDEAAQGRNNEIDQRHSLRKYSGVAAKP